MPSPTLDDLAGRQFVAQRPAVNVVLRFDTTGGVGVTLGINKGYGLAAVVDGRLTVSELRHTLIGSSPAMMRQEEAIATLLNELPAITFDGSTLVVAGSTLTLRFDEQDL